MAKVQKIAPYNLEFRKISVLSYQTDCFYTAGRKCNFTEKTDLLIFTLYLLTPIAYFPIVVRIVSMFLL